MMGAFLVGVGIGSLCPPGLGSAALVIFQFAKEETAVRGGDGSELSCPLPGEQAPSCSLTLAEMNYYLLDLAEVMGSLRSNWKCEPRCAI